MHWKCFVLTGNRVLFLCQNISENFLKLIKFHIDSDVNLSPWKWTLFKSGAIKWHTLAWVTIFGTNLCDWYTLRGAPLDIQGGMEVWVGQSFVFLTPQPGDFFSSPPSADKFFYVFEWVKFYFLYSSGGWSFLFKKTSMRPPGYQMVRPLMWISLPVFQSLCSTLI